MITLTNKTANYTLANETEGFKLSGQVQIKEEDNSIVNFNGTFTKDEGTYCGNFFYSENNSKKTNKSINDVDTDDFTSVDTLLDSTIAELKQMLNDNE